MPYPHRERLWISVLAAGLCGCGAPNGAPPAGSAAPPPPPPTTAVSYGFDADGAGRLPAGFSVIRSPSGESAWRIEASPAAASLPNALRWTGERAETGLAVSWDATASAGAAEVHLRPIGDAPPEAETGIVFDYRDPRHFCEASVAWRAGRLSIHRTRDGRRETLAHVDLTAPPSPNQWHVLTLSWDGRAVTCTLVGGGTVAAATQVATGARAGLLARGTGEVLFDEFSLTPR